MWRCPIHGANHPFIFHGIFHEINHPAGGSPMDFLTSQPWWHPMLPTAFDQLRCCIQPTRHGIGILDIGGLGGLGALDTMGMSLLNIL